MTSKYDEVPIWVDVDTGHDVTCKDAFALLLAAYSDRTRLLGASTVHGNASLRHTTWNTRSILEAIGANDITVHPGSDKPLLRDAVHAESIHGESGLGGVTLLPDPKAPIQEEMDFVKPMTEAILRTPPNSTWIVATGALTNISRVMKENPRLAKHIRGLSIMGGAVGNGFTDAPMGTVQGEGERFGNWTPFAEFNIYVSRLSAILTGYIFQTIWQIKMMWLTSALFSATLKCDPEAASNIFSNAELRSKTTLIPLDLTHMVLATADIRKQILLGPNTDKAVGPGLIGAAVDDEQFNTHKVGERFLISPVRALFYQIIVFFAKTYAEVFALTRGPPLHDPVAVAAAFDPDIFGNDPGDRFLVKVVTDGYCSDSHNDIGQLGRTLVEKLPHGSDGVRIPKYINLERFWSHISEAIEKSEKHSQMTPVDSTTYNNLVNSLLLS